MVEVKYFLAVPSSSVLALAALDVLPIGLVLSMFFEMT